MLFFGLSGMLVAALAVTAAASKPAAASEPSFSTPPPPRQSAVQKRVMAQTAETAAAASAAATAPLLKLLASPDFAKGLDGCCPELLGKVPAELLAIYGEQVVVTEVAHGFFAVNPPAQNNAADVNLTQAAAASWFYNEWQLQVVLAAAGSRSPADFWEVIGGSCSLGPAAAAELGVFGLPSFSESIPQVPGAFPGGWPADLAEASDRVVYTLFNQRRGALPCAPWGDVNVVFAPQLTKDVVLLSPFDTGDYEVGCNTSYRTNMDKAFERDCALQRTEADCESMGFMCRWSNGKCSSERGGGGGFRRRRKLQPRGGSMCNWTLTMGTMQYHNHVLLDNVRLGMGGWSPGGGGEASSAAGMLGGLFKEMFEPLDNRTDGGFTNSYFEVELLGTAAYPDGIHFVMAGFDSLFGSPAGAALQAWCAKWKWPLLWTSEGGGWSPGGGAAASGPQRLLDPVVLAGAKAGANYSAAAAKATPAFRKLWGNHSAPTPGGVPLPGADGGGGAMWDDLVKALGAGLAIEPLQRGRCSGDCIGTVPATGDCVCY